MSVPLLSLAHGQALLAQYSSLHSLQQMVSLDGGRETVQTECQN
jgi:hypothetical protein